MLNSTKQKIKLSKINAMAQLILIAVSLIVFLIVQFAVGKEVLGFAPIWMLFIVYLFGAFLFGLTFGIITRSVLAVIFGGVAGVLGLEILLFCVANIKYWYVWIIIGLVALILIFVSTFFLKAETLAVEFNNQPDSGRKTYAERQAEKKEQEEKEKAEEKPLPEIKSFKD